MVGTGSCSTVRRYFRAEKAYFVLIPINSDDFNKWRFIFSYWKLKIVALSFIISSFCVKIGEEITTTRVPTPECKQNSLEAHKSLIFRKNKNELVPKWNFCLAQNFDLVLRLRLSEITQFRLIITPRIAYTTFYIFLSTSNHFSLTISLIFHPLRISLTNPNQKSIIFLCKFGLVWENLGKALVATGSENSNENVFGNNYLHF